MTLPYPPPWMDSPTLAAHICVSAATVDNWVRQGILPPPRKRGGKLMWKWAEVDRYLRGQIYFVDGGDLIKIGFTTNMDRRMKALQAHSPCRLRIILVVQGSRIREAALHEKFAHLRMHGEWFKADLELHNFIRSLEGEAK